MPPTLARLEWTVRVRSSRASLRRRKDNLSLCNFDNYLCELDIAVVNNSIEGQNSKDINGNAMAPVLPE